VSEGDTMDKKEKTEFGQSFYGFIRNVNRTKLVNKVSVLIGQPDVLQVAAKINNLASRINTHSGVIRASNKELFEAIVKGVVEIDSDMKLKGEKILKGISYQTSNMNEFRSWIVALKSGKEVSIKDGFEGDKIYKLIIVR